MIDILAYNTTNLHGIDFATNEKYVNKLILNG